MNRFGGTVSATGHQAPLRRRTRLGAIVREVASIEPCEADTPSSMSQRNIELHSRGAAAANAREVPLDLLAPGFRMENRVTAVTDNSYHGADGWREWMSDLFDVFADGARYEVEEIIAAGEDFVAAMLCVTGRGARSGLAITFRWAGVTWFRDGMATRAVGYATRGEALEAVGLHE
jgi:ketosteroid isomerase-like protein